MENITIKDIVEACSGQLLCGDENKVIKEFSIDSRSGSEDSIFVPIIGERVDAHKFIDGALKINGATFTSEHDEPLEGFENKPWIKVADTVEAMQKVGTFYRNRMNLPVVAVTGSVGKTTTREMISTVLASQKKVFQTIGNQNSQIGVPLTLSHLTREDEIAVLEMGISDFGEMDRLSKIAQPDISVITNIGLCHLENLKTRDGILKAKTEIFKSMNPDGTVILNGDDDKLITIKNVYDKKPVFFGIENKCGIYAENIVNNGLEGMTARICNVNTADNINDFDVHIPVAGIHMVYNSMAAAAVGAEFGLTSEQIADGIANMETIAGRNHIIKTDSLLILDDCYNANPVSMKSSIDVLASSKGRKVAILGDMFELGEEEKQLHREVGEYFKNKNIDVLITVGELSKNIAAGVRTVSVCDVHSYNTKDELEKDFTKLLKKGDNILVKASHGMQFTKIVDSLEKLEL